MTASGIAPDAVAEALGIPGNLVDAEAHDRYARGVWSCLTEPGDGVAGALIAGWGAAAALLQVTQDDPEAGAMVGIDADTLGKARARWRPRWRDAPRAFAAARRYGARLVVPDDPEWPRRVDDLGIHAPICLWVRGTADLLGSPAPAVGIVGARAATAYGEDIAMDLAAALAGSGMTIVSGAAYGIDGAAHRAALAAGGATVALLAGGIDRPYPAGHADLLGRIASHGVVAAEVPCGTTPTKWRFLARNRMIAAMADATVVVEAGWRSGSLNTAHHAAALGRPLGAVPGPVTSAASMGCHRLLREVDAVCITGADDVRELMGLGGGDRGAGDLTSSRERVRVVDALSARATRSTEEVARRSGMSPGDAAGELALLELSGEVTRSPAGWRRAAG